MVWPVIVLLMTVGCTPSYKPGRHLIKVEHGGEHRQFHLFVPEGMRVGATPPIVFGIHGIRSSPEWYQQKASLENALEEKKWLGVIPFGVSKDMREGEDKCCNSGPDGERDCEGSPTPNQTCSWNAGRCCGFASSSGSNDIGYFRFIVHWATVEMCADQKSVFATGFSNGGMMTNRLGCEAADIFLAIAPVAGNLQFDNCQPARPISYISFCGGMDGVCVSDFTETIKYWASVSNCSSEPRVSWTSATAECLEYSCHNGIFVEYCFIPDLRHEYPGLPSQPSTNPDATKMIFSKFEVAIQNRILYSDNNSSGAISHSFVCLFATLLTLLVFTLG